MAGEGSLGGPGGIVAETIFTAAPNFKKWFGGRTKFTPEDARVLFKPIADAIAARKPPKISPPPSDQPLPVPSDQPLPVIVRPDDSVYGLGAVAPIFRRTISGSYEKIVKADRRRTLKLPRSKAEKLFDAAKKIYTRIPAGVKRGIPSLAGKVLRRIFLPVAILGTAADVIRGVIEEVSEARQIPKSAPVKVRAAPPRPKPAVAKPPLGALEPPRAVAPRAGRAGFTPRGAVGPQKAPVKMPAKSVITPTRSPAKVAVAERPSPVKIPANLPTGRVGVRPSIQTAVRSFEKILQLSKIYNQFSSSRNSKKGRPIAGASPVASLAPTRVIDAGNSLATLTATSQATESCYQVCRKVGGEKKKRAARRVCVSADVAEKAGINITRNRRK